MRWKWLLFCLPAGLGLILALILTNGALANPVLYLRADLASLVVLAGVLGSVLIAAWLLLRQRGEQALNQVAAEAKAQAADERRRFLRRLDHELKNPLTAIRAGLANLAEAPSEDAHKDALGSVEAQTLRLSRLLADLRKLADLETQELERTPVDLAELLREAVSAIQEWAVDNQRRVTLTLPQAPWPLPAVSGDRDLLSLALHNLLDNALKFGRPGDTVEVRAYEDGATVAIEVADTGPGIPEDEQPHVWEELYRGQGARGVPGTGLGLALVRAVLVRHGGQLGLRSRTGQGTVFTLRLPVG